MAANATRFTLRDLTRDHHERLDNKVGTLESVPAYHRYLTGMHVFRTAVDSGLRSHAFPPAFDGWRPTLIADELQKDMADLSLRPAADAAPAIDVPGDLSELVGMLYVLEGSTLGARILVKQAAALGFDAANGARHLARQTGDPASWGRFQAILESCADAIDMDKAAASARKIFDTAYRAFEALDDQLALEAAG